MAADTVQSNASLSHLIQQEMHHVLDLTKALEAEKDALGRNDHEGLVGVIAQKQAIIDGLNQVDQRRGQLLRGAGYGSDQAGIESYIGDQPEPKRQQLRDLWRQLLRAVSECQQKNLVNGSIIGMNLRHCAHAVSILCGHDPRQELYDPRGNASSTQPHGRPIKA